MKVFIDCTHTANHPYKNTGIHRVVRQLISEFSEISKDDPNLEVIPVKFNADFMCRVNSLEREAERDSERNESVRLIDRVKRIYLKNKFVSKFKSLRHRIINKIKRTKPFDRAIALLIKSTKSTRKAYSAFEGTKFSSQDVYLMPDANWDLPNSYYSFLRELKTHGVTVVLICHDLIPIKFPEFCSKSFSKDFTEYYVQCSSLCDKIIGVSRNSADDYIAAKEDGIITNSNPNQVVESFRLGCDYSKDKNRSSAEKNLNEEIESLLSKRYLLVVGSLSPHKNAKTIVAAFDLLASNQNIHLVFAGNRGWHPETDLLIESNEMYGRLIHILSSVTDYQLQLLYEHCYCLIQASLYEGFGLPVVEALQSGKPVISSTAGSLREVGGDFCIYFDPHQPQELYQALKKLLDSDTDYNQLVTRIKTEYKPFSWRESAEQLLSLLRSESR